MNFKQHDKIRIVGFFHPYWCVSFRELFFLLYLMQSSPEVMPVEAGKEFCGRLLLPFSGQILTFSASYIPVILTLRKERSSLK
jgi:hypothetical protein